jgi:hypothetical protein
MAFAAGPLTSTQIWMVKGWPTGTTTEAGFKYSRVAGVAGGAELGGVVAGCLAGGAVHPVSISSPSRNATDVRW